MELVKLLEMINKGHYYLNEFLKSARWYILAWTIVWEGSIELSGHKMPVGSRKFRLKPRLCVVNTDRKLLERLQSVIGEGRIYDSNRKDESLNRKKRWIWLIQDLTGVNRVLSHIIHLLPSKEKQAKLLMKYVDSRLSTYLTSPYTDEEMEMYHEMKKLNRRGLR